MLAWIDLEMTGLEPSRNVIVEIATIVTDDQLNIVAEGPDMVIGATPEQLADMDEVVRRMHTTSGLLVAIAKSTVTVDEAAEATLEFLKAHIATPGSVPLCGNSIAMDRSFLRQYMPSVDDYFHYRTIDVSSVKELCKRWYHDLYVARPQKVTAHRALDDIRESVAELLVLPRAALPHPSGDRGADSTGRSSRAGGHRPVTSRRRPRQARAPRSPKPPCRRGTAGASGGRRDAYSCPAAPLKWSVLCGTLLLVLGGARVERDHHLVPGRVPRRAAICSSTRSSTTRASR